MLGLLLKPEIEQLIQEGKLTELRDALSELPPADVADALVDLPPESSAVVFRILPRALAAETFDFLPVDVQEAILKAMADKDVRELLEAMAPDDRTRLLEELPASVTKRLMDLLPPEELSLVKTLLGYPEDSVGRRMTPEYIAVHIDWLVGQALQYIRRYGKNKETLNVVYVTDERGRLCGDVRISDLLLASDDQPIMEIMDDSVPRLLATDDQERAVEMFGRYRRDALPVVSSDGVLLGILTVDDVLDVAQEEATEDIQKFGGTLALAEPYLRVNTLTMVLKRAPWLVILFISEMLTSTALSFYEHQIASVAALAFFIPLIISSGGNSGSQAATLINRALALGEVTVKDAWRVFVHEIRAGALLGLPLAAIVFVRIMVWHWITPEKLGPIWLSLAITVSLAVICVVLWGNLMGSLLPLLFKTIGVDPAVTSAPFVATLVDVTGIIIYFTIASFVVFGNLH
ncbi:MAG: magnesium transporter [Candidatus Sumerlaeaceae bacterium]|nr:magnesium transporter [Candidatus Sumerlaeaceae bacterium]